MNNLKNDVKEIGTIMRNTILQIIDHSKKDGAMSTLLWSFASLSYI